MGIVVVDAAGGEVHGAGANRFRILAQAPDHPVGIVEATVPPGFPGPVRHRHARMTDIFYVLEGTLVFDVAGERQAAGPGAFVLVPPGMVHTFANPGSAPARFLNMYQPAGFEHYLAEVGRRMDGGHP